LAENPLDTAVIHAKISESFERPEIREKIRFSANVVIVIDDATRPTPSRVLLPMIIGELERHASNKLSISIVVALGAHKPLEAESLRALVGPETYDKYPIFNHQARDDGELEDLGTSSFGTPVKVNRFVVRADLRVLVGMIKPHNQAGYTGGGKAILPGVCGLETISANHSFRYMSHPGSRIGVLEGNPIRSDIDDAFRKLGPSILVNVVMDRAHAVADVVVGDDVVEAHKAGARIYDRMGRFCFDRLADVCICGTPDPIDCNFYQMLNALSAPHRLPRSVVKEGGTIIVFGRADQGISDGDMLEALTWYPRKTVRARVFSSDSKFADRPALQIFLECEERYRIIVATEERNLKWFSEMGIEACSVTQGGQVALQALAGYGPQANCLVLPDAPYVILDSNIFQEESHV